jgi:hypothetical protein
MLRFFLGIVVGYVARDELRKAVKEAVKGVVRVQSEMRGSYAALKEDVTDAVHEERAAAQSRGSAKP